MNRGQKEFSFLWFIENYSYCGLKGDEEFSSPEFTPEGLGTSWVLLLYPERLERGENSVSLKRSDDDSGPQNFSLTLEISIITANGSTLYSEECETTFRKGETLDFNAFVNLDELYGRRNTDYLPQDTLGVRCRMWRGKGCVHMVGQCSARTRIGLEKICFLHRVQNFSALRLNERKYLKIPSHSETGCVFHSNLYIADSVCLHGSIIVDITCSDENYVLSKTKLSLIDVSGNIVDCAKLDFRFYHSAEDLERIHLSFTRQFILNKRNEYLPNDELSLLCECTFYTGVEFQKIEEILYKIPVMAYDLRYSNGRSDNDRAATENSGSIGASEDPTVKDNHKSLTNADLKADAISDYNIAPSTTPFVTVNQPMKNDTNKGIFKAADKLSACPSVMDDFKSLYDDQLLTDVVLKTATKSFPAHRIVLCARSSVFRAMLTNEMKEKNTDCIRMDDLENETVHQLLLFLYSDNLEKLKWESAIRLYYAGDKYDIKKLIVLCSTFLVDNLSASTAGELLLLADTHSDAELKQSVDNFILEHEKEVFGSDEWEKLIETNPLLVMKTMHLKYKREKEEKAAADINATACSADYNQPNQSQPVQKAQPQPAFQTQAVQQPTAAVGQEDHSAAWVDYYRSLGMFREAAMIEQQSRGGANPARRRQKRRN